MMVQESLQRTSQPLTEAEKRKLALQLCSAATQEASALVVTEWDTESALETLAAILKRHRHYSTYSLQEWKRELPFDLLPNVLYPLMLWSKLGWLSILTLLPSFLIQFFMRNVFPLRARRLRERLVSILEARLKSATPSMLPAVLEAGIALGNPESDTILKQTLIHLLPLLDTSTAKRLTAEQHHYLLSLLKTTDEELLIATLLAIGTRGDARDTNVVRDTVPHLNERVREVKRECLSLLECTN